MQSTPDLKMFIKETKVKNASRFAELALNSVCFSKLLLLQEGSQISHWGGVVGGGGGGVSSHGRRINCGPSRARPE